MESVGIAVARQIAVAQQTVAVETVGFSVRETAEIAAVDWQTAAEEIAEIVAEETVEIAVDLKECL